MRICFSENIEKIFIRSKIVSLLGKAGWILPALLIITCMSRFVYYGYLRSFVESAYNKNTYSFLNNLISGRDVYNVEYYLDIADLYFGRIYFDLILILSILFFSKLLFVARNIYDITNMRFVSIFGFVNSLLLFPPIFDKCFALRKLQVSGYIFLLGLSMVFIFLFFMSLRIRRSYAKNMLCSLFSILLLIDIELGVRFMINLFPAVRQNISSLSDITYPKRARYHGHPFLHFTGNPDNVSTEKFSYQQQSRYNSFGFIGNEFQYYKGNNVVRIACLGGSTTESGYPEVLEKLLNKRKDGKRYEVLNFGIAAWSSGHSLVNFVLNVRDFSPDYVIIHHGWNDGPPARISLQNRGDYSEGLKPFDPPRHADRYLIRASVIYRYIAHLIKPTPDFAILVNAIEKKDNAIGKNITLINNYYSNITRLERNIKTIIELAIVDGIRVVLTTMPHTTDHQVRDFEMFAYVSENNKLIRTLASKYSNLVELVDLDKHMTGVDNDLFIDFAHVNKEGHLKKSKYISNVIKSDNSIK